MTEESVIEMGYDYIGEVDGLKLYTNINSTKYNLNPQQGFIVQFNPKYEKAIGQIFVTKDILKQLINS